MYFLQHLYINAIAQINQAKKLYGYKIDYSVYYQKKPAIS
ncbi:hypothetical protein NT05LM_2349 [Listeria marthii FSL S4-120]|uniref:Uncharacterized protein n=1 Tax=Listeria marthii FSL S4-120 TaxID=702457 RepID=A0ABN0BVU8_9LIST|nr:hypothetical protein NT05LM_2349 [Listeria marthii FSL S4-120]